MSLSIAYNTTDTPVLADSAGYLIDGRGWGPVDPSDPIGKAELAAGNLILADEKQLAGSDNDAATAAVKVLQSRRDALAAARAQSKAELAEQVPAEVLAAMPVGGDGLPSKDALVDAAAAASAAEDDTTPKPRRGSTQK